MTLRGMINTMPLPFYSMDTGGDGGGGDDGFMDELDEGDELLGDGEEGGLDFSALFGEEGEGDQSGLNEGDGITGDAASILGDLFKTTPAPVKKRGTPAGDGNNTLSAEDEEAAAAEAIQTQLTDQLQTGLNGLSIPEELIPDDFNPSDPKALRTLLGKVQQHTARNAISLMFAPVQVAMGRMAQTLRAEIAAKANSTVNESAATRLLEQNVPAARDPNLRPIVDLLFTQAKQKFPTDMRAQVRATRRAVAAMNLKSGSKAPRGKSGESAEQALDLYSPRPNARPNQPGNGNKTVTLTAKQQALLALFSSK